MRFPRRWIVVTVEGSVVYANARACQVLDRRHDEVLGAELSDLRDLTPASLRTGDRLELRHECQIRSRPGELSNAGYASAPIGSRLIALAFRDIGDAARLQAERDRLLQLAAVAEAMPTLPHEVKNPLSAILTTVELKYVRFRAAAVSDLPTPVHSTPPTPDLAEFRGVEGWDALLRWVCAAYRAHSAFLIDGQGLLVARAGQLDRERAEGVGAGMVFAMEHADRMSDGVATRSIVVDFGEHVATSLRARAQDGRQFALGVPAAGPLPLEARRNAERALVTKLSAE